MKVPELIAKLEKMPQDVDILVVCFVDDDSVYDMMITGVDLEDGDVIITAELPEDIEENAVKELVEDDNAD